jgi:hypothetical protein
MTSCQLWNLNRSAKISARFSRRRRKPPHSTTCLAKRLDQYQEAHRATLREHELPWTKETVGTSSAKTVLTPEHRTQAVPGPAVHEVAPLILLKNLLSRCRSCLMSRQKYLSPLSLIPLSRSHVGEPRNHCPLKMLSPSLSFPSQTERIDHGPTWIRHSGQTGISRSLVSYYHCHQLMTCRLDAAFRIEQIATRLPETSALVVPTDERFPKSCVRS